MTKESALRMTLLGLSVNVKLSHAYEPYFRLVKCLVTQIYRSGSSWAGSVHALVGIGIPSTRPRPFGRNCLEPLQIIHGEGDGTGSDILFQFCALFGARDWNDVVSLSQQPGKGQLTCCDVFLIGQAAHLGDQV